MFSVLGCLSVMRDSDGSTENWFSVEWNWVYIVLVSFLLAMIMLSNIGVDIRSCAYIARPIMVRLQRSLGGNMLACPSMMEMSLILFKLLRGKCENFML